MRASDDLRIRISSVRLGAASTVAVALATAGYAGASWHEPNRPLMAGLGGAFALLGALLLIRRIAELITGPARNAHFMAWSALCTTGITTVFYLDGAGRSPLAYGFVLALAFGGCFIPSVARSPSPPWWNAGT